MNDSCSKTTLYWMAALSLGLALPVSAQTPEAAPAAPAAEAAPAAAAPAQTEAAAAGDDISEVIVTARRVQERLQDVPISITVFSQQDITNQNIVSANELAKFTPSLQTNARFGSESASFSIRGFVQEGQTSPSVAVYFADVTAPRAQGGTSAGNGAGPGAFFDLQNVQVLKGPQGTLFGRNTTGGAVLLVPQKPKSEFGGYGELSVGDYGLFRQQGAVNTPFSDSVRVRLSMDSMHRDGYLNNVSGVGPKDFADIGYTALRLSVVADLSENIENYTIFSSSESNTNGFYPKVINQDNGGSAAQNPRTRDPFPSLRAAQIAATSGDYWDIANGNPNAFQEIKQKQLINTTTWNASDTLTVKNIASYARFTQAQSANIYGENGFQNDTAIPYYAVNVAPQPGSHNASQQTFTEELQLQGRTENDAFTYQTGVYFEKSIPLNGFQQTYSANTIACSNIDQLACQNVTTEQGRTTTGFIQNSRSQYHFQDLGVYAQGTYKFSEQWSLTGGVRYTRDETEGLGQVLKISFPTPNTPSYNCSQPTTTVQGGTPAQVEADPSLCNYALEEKSSKPTWSIDLDYKPTQDVMLYGKYARGYRQGGVNASSYGLETWKPEQVDLYELGAKTSWQAAVSGNFNIAVFYNDFTDQQIAINTVSCGNVVNPNVPFGTIIPPGTPGLPPGPYFPACIGIPSSEYPSPAQGIGNGGKSTIQGVEVDASFNLFQGFILDVGYAYLDTELKSIEVPPVQRGFAAFTPNAIVGGPLQNTPENKYTITATYKLPLPTSAGQVRLSGTYTAQDEAFGNNSSLTLKTLPKQKQLNLNVNWTDVASTPVDIGLFATNVTNEKYYVFATGASFGWDAVVLNEPAMYGARIKYKFGAY